MAAANMKIGFIPANRGFFSSELAAAMRSETIDAMRQLALDPVVLEDGQSKLGCVETRQEAEACARLFREQEVEGIVIGAVNFGDEQAAALAVKQAGLNVPVLIFGCQEEHALTPGMSRRDAFCGLLSIGEALRQVGFTYSVGQRPVCFPSDQSFRDDLDWFVRVCRVVNGIRKARYGQIGARPDAFWTCRFDEKRLQRLGPTTVTLDLSEVFGGVRAISDDDAEVRDLIKSIADYADSSKMADSTMLRMAKLELFLRRWQAENDLDAFAVQCWTSIQRHYGVCACTTMSRFTDTLTPAACEADILGTLSMHALQLASGKPAALADWNNLHNDDDDLVNIWHCGVFPKSFAKEQPRLASHEILLSAGIAAENQVEGVVELQMKASPVTLSRITQDVDGGWQALIAQGQIEDNPATTSGSYGWCRIEDLQWLYRNVVLQRFPHHVAITPATIGNVLWEAFGNYLGFDVFHTRQATPGQYQTAMPFNQEP